MNRVGGMSCARQVIRPLETLTGRTQRRVCKPKRVVLVLERYLFSTCWIDDVDAAPVNAGRLQASVHVEHIANPKYSYPAL